MVEDMPLAYKLAMIGHMMQLQGNSILQEKCNLALSSYIILHKTHYKKLNQQEIADKLQLTTAAISKRIKILIEKGYIASTINEENRRENIISLTTKGKEIHDKADEILKEQLNKMISSFDEKEELERLLNKLIPCMCKQ